MKKRGSALNSKYSGRNAIIGFSFVYLLLALSSYARTGYLSIIHTVVPATIIILTMLFYLILDKYFRNTSNKVLVYLRDLSFFDIAGVLIAGYSLRFLYRLFFSFYNVNSTELYPFFISFFITVIIGALLFLLSLFKYKRGSGLFALFEKSFLFVDFIYRLGIQDHRKPTYLVEYKKPKIIKIINSAGYILFIVYLIAVIVAANYSFETEGVFESAQYKYVTTKSKYSGVSFSKLMTIDLYTKDKQITEFVIGAKAVKDFENNYKCRGLQPGYIVKIKHHPFAYSWPYFNEVVSCRI